ncbi:MAG TPA: carboxypeptidase regulatory-like domain-containing protein [Bryobacteraceae bacterium]|nr:carboxypeptidase regulatory-like domain-containing protein [Bryobacteraceae bacterium]
MLPLLLLGSAVVSFSQEKKVAKIEGRVVDSVTGEPVRKATLSIKGSAVESDASGRFLFDGLEPGTYRVMARKPGYPEQFYGTRSPLNGGGIGLTVAAGEHLKGIEFKLIPQCVIAGRVVDEDGEPVQDAYVSVLRRTPSGHVNSAAGETTNDLGEFRIPNLDAGRYLVIAGARWPRIYTSGARKSDEPVDAPVPTYYPGVIDAAAATAIDLRPGRTAGGLEIIQRKTRAYRVEGTLSGLTAAYPARSLQLILAPRDRKDALGQIAPVYAEPDGKFIAENVIPGAYMLNVLARVDRQTCSLGRAPVDVTSGHVRGVVVNLTEPVAVSGTVSIEGNQTFAFDTLRLTLRPEEGMLSGGRPAPVNPDGTFRFDGLGVAKYDIHLYGLGDTAYLKAARWGKQDILDTGLDLSNAQGPVALELVLSLKPGTVEGAVQVEGKAQPGASVSLLPDPPRGYKRQFQGFATTDQNGRFSIKGMAPGTYTLYAIAQPEYIGMLSDEAIKALESRAEKITVQEGRTTQANLTPVTLEAVPEPTP